MDYKNIDKKFKRNKKPIEFEKLFFYFESLGIKEIPHKFINFETYEQIPGFRKKILKSDDCAKYNSKTNKIEIFEEIMNPKFVNNLQKFHEKSFHKLLFDSIQDTDFLKLIFIHEVAHYIQHQEFKQQQKLLNNSQNNIIHNFINKTLFYSNPEEYCKLFYDNDSQQDSKSRKDTNEHLHRIVTEGFSDSFSYIVFHQTANNKEESLNILNHHLNARKTAREATIEYYFTDYLLTHVLDDLKQGKNFSSLLEIKNYINKQIENYIPKFIEERLKKDDDISLIMNKRYLGYVSKRLQINSIEDLNKKLEEIGISTNVLYKNNKPRFDFNDKEFQLGIKIAESFLKDVNSPSFSKSVLPEKTTSIKNISSLRKQFTVTSKNSPTNTI